MPCCRGRPGDLVRRGASKAAHEEEPHARMRWLAVRGRTRQARDGVMVMRGKKQKPQLRRDTNVVSRSPRQPQLVDSCAKPHLLTLFTDLRHLINEPGRFSHNFPPGWKRDPTTNHTGDWMKRPVG
jgi:hypothetical protein